MLKNVLRTVRYYILSIIWELEPLLVYNYIHSLVKKTPTINAITEMQKKNPKSRNLTILQSSTLQPMCHSWFPLVWTGFWFFLSPNICTKCRVLVTGTSLCNTWNYLETKWHLCFTSQEKELHSKPSPSIRAATQTSLTAPVLEIHGDKLYLLLLLLHGLKETKLLKGITTIRKIYIKSHHLHLTNTF